MALTCRCLARRMLKYTLLPRVATARFASNGDDRKSGAYPRTPEERAAAAKKYNIRVQDYEPYPDDGFGWGDYPKFPAVHEDYKDPHGDWDFPDQRRNFGETPHIDYDVMVRNRPAPYLEGDNIPQWKQAAILGGVLVTLGFLFYAGQKYKLFQPAAPKQYPYNDLWIEKGGDPDNIPEKPKHYEF
ncbi:putative NADH dehydrogenase [Apostichopus japonicus]|uniref:Putative NADH dehydrogenase n=1 Tax=Stichopus japonicus TaxID=307972 RepID=A0A2G8KYQ0_STIJA|nr:putative NADH dehydrogenase [Apostichopus japonicus]